MAIGPVAFDLACHYIVGTDGQVQVLTIVLVCLEPTGSWPGQWHSAYVEHHARLRSACQTKFTNPADLAYINEVLLPRVPELLPRMARALDAIMRADHSQSIAMSLHVRISKPARTISIGGGIHTGPTEWLRWGGSAPELRPAAADHPTLTQALLDPDLLDELERPALLALFAGAF